MLSMSTSNENKENNSTQTVINSQDKSGNPMKSVQTKSLPTKTVYFSEQKKKKEDGHSSD